MTMIVVDAQHNHAEIMTDTLSMQFDNRQAWVAENPKVTVLPAINAAVASRGHAAMGQVWRQMATSLAGRVDDFDEFAERSQDTLRIILAEAKTRPWYGRLEALGDKFTGGLHAYMVGWSPSRGRFVAYVAVDDAFDLIDISDEFHVTPAPLGARPTGIEQALFTHTGHPLPDGEPLTPPTGTAGWVDLAKTIHGTRAVRQDVGLTADPLQVRIGGPVHLTRLTAVAEPTLERIHTFDAEDFRAAFTGSFHPVGQLSACPCGSRRRYLDCHIAQWRALPCHCGSGATLEDCCMLDVEGTEAAEWFADYPDLARQAAPAHDAARNDPCPCGSGAKYKRCCQLALSGPVEL